MNAMKKSYKKINNNLLSYSLAKRDRDQQQAECWPVGVETCTQSDPHPTTVMCWTRQGGPVAREF